MPEDDDIANVLQALKNYISKTIETQFSVPRKLSDGTPVSGLSGYELSVLMKTLTDCTIKGGQFVGCYEFKGKASPYTAIMIGLWPLLAQRAQAEGKSLLWVSATGAMKANAQLNMMSLVALLGDSVRFTLWGDLVETFGRDPEAIRKTIVIGDADFEPGNTIGKIQSMNGSRHEEALQGIRKMAADPACEMIVFHREALNAAFDLAAIGDLMAKRNTAAAEKKSGCFIATAACGSPTSWEVQVLQQFRNKILLRSKPGQWAVETYYRLSPPLAGWIEGRPRAQRFFRRFLINPLARAAAKQVAQRGKDSKGW